MGKKLLAAGQLADALSHYHAAVGKWLEEVLPFLDRSLTYITYAYTFVSIDILKWSRKSLILAERIRD